MSCCTVKKNVYRKYLQQFIFLNKCGNACIIEKMMKSLNKYVKFKFLVKIYVLENEIEIYN